MLNTTIVDLRNERCDIYIGRSTMYDLHYGNPFRVGPNRTREQVNNDYELWLRGCQYIEKDQPRRKWILGTLHNLYGKKLGGYDDISVSHGHVLIKLINEALAVPALSRAFTESR